MHQRFQGNPWQSGYFRISGTCVREMFPPILSHQTLRKLQGTCATFALQRSSTNSGKKKEHKDKLFGSGDRPVGWGSSTRRGGGQKLRARPRKFVFLGFRREESGMSREFCRDVPDPWGCSKSLCKKTSCAFFVPSTNCRRVA